MRVGTSVLDMQTADRSEDAGALCAGGTSRTGAGAKISIALLNQSLNRLFYEK